MSYSIDTIKDKIKTNFLNSRKTFVLPMMYPIRYNEWPPETETVFCRFSDGSCYFCYFCYSEISGEYAVVDVVDKTSIAPLTGRYPVAWTLPNDEVKSLFLKDINIEEDII